MNWKQLLSAKRVSSSSGTTDIRSQFQRDYDRIIFSSPFRRLQNKTQVFPLPGSVFVHNRLTHSLEVASVGRSLANNVSKQLQQRHDIDTETKDNLNELGSIVSAACLAHDLGNPPFGHSGEKAISQYFTVGNGKALQSRVSPEQWTDLKEFEGNANAFRILTHQFQGRRKGGFALTNATLASLVKYPYSSSTRGDRKKYGFFYSEIEAFHELAYACGLPLIDEANMIFARHPLVYLVEAADDISYLIMDIEDAHKLSILSTEKTEFLLRSFFQTAHHKSQLAYIDKMYAEVTDINERIGFLRAMVINLLVQEVTESFHSHYEDIMQGSFKNSLVEALDKEYTKAFDICRSVSVEQIYNHASVIKIELAGFSILGSLMDVFIEAVLEPKKAYHKKLISLIPKQFTPNSDDMYSKLQSVIDFISGMTDLYALELYQDLKGFAK